MAGKRLYEKAAGGELDDDALVPLADIQQLAIGGGCNQKRMLGVR